MLEEITSKGSRTINSSPSRQNYASKSSFSKLNNKVKEETTLYMIHSSKRTDNSWMRTEKSWRKSVYTTRTERSLESPRSKASVCKLPLIKNTNNRININVSGETGDVSRVTRKQIPCTFTPQYNLRERNFYPNFRSKIIHHAKDQHDDSRFT